jgi:hypothetical protein
MPKTEKKPVSTRKVTNKKCQEMTVKAIKAHRKYKTIEGRSTMNKEELCKALVKATKPKPKKAKTENPKVKKTEKSKTEKPKVKKEKTEKPKVKKTEKPKVKKEKTEKPKVKKTEKTEKPKVKKEKTENPKVKKTRIPKPKVPKTPAIKGVGKENAPVRSPIRNSPKKIVEKPVTPISPLREVRNSDLTVLDIQDLIGKSPKSKYLRPIPKTMKQEIAYHKLGKAGKQNAPLRSPIRNSPKKIEYEDNYTPITIEYNGEVTTIYKNAGDYWQTVFNALPKDWGKGKLIDTTLTKEYEIAPLAKIPSVPVSARFEPESTGILSFLF